MKSWKTTVCGLLALVGALLPQFYPAWHHGAFLAALASGLGLLLARDHDSDQSPPDMPVPVKISTLSVWLLAGFAAMLLLAGCSRFRSVQVETAPDGSHRETRQTISTFWDSQSEVSKVRATTTDKSQGLSIGAISQESSSTNTADLLKSVVGAAVSAGVNAAK